MGKEERQVFYGVVLDDLVQIRQFVRETAVSHTFPSPAIDELIVAVNEAVANIIRHGYQNKPGDIAIKISSQNNTIQVTLLDNSFRFNPTILSSPDITLPLAERPFGGMGAHMMREFCDEVSYRRTENKENELILLKRVDHKE